MNRLIVLVTTMLFLIVAIEARAEVAPCNFGNPWLTVRGVSQQNEVEYTYEYLEETFPGSTFLPVEVDILTGDGPSTCMLTLRPGVSLVYPNGFNPETGYYQGMSESEMPWIKVGYGIYPINKKHRLFVARPAETKVFMLPAEQTKIFQRPSPFYDLEDPRPQVVESRCGGVCGAIITLGTLAVIYLLANKNKSNPPPPPPPAVTTGGAY